MEKIVAIEISSRSETQGEKLNAVGSVSVPCPTVEFFGLSAEKDEDGVYKDSKIQWLQDAIESRVQAIVKSRLVPKSIEWRKGFRAWNSLSEFFTSLAPVAKGSHLKIAAEFRAAFKAFVDEQNWSPSVKEKVLDLSNAKTLAAARPEIKKLVEPVFTAFLESITEEQAARFDNELSAIQEALKEDSLAALLAGLK